jgi:iron complex outermembrane receptor protein
MMAAFERENSFQFRRFTQTVSAGVSTIALGATLLIHPANAEQQKPKETQSFSVEDVIVTGTRDYGVKARESTAPVTVISAAKLERTGQSNLLGALQRLNPSYSFSGFGGDLNNLVRSPRLRGLSTNHVLVLVNGKRRHGTANLSSTTFTKGSAGADIEFIPVSAVDHIEILEDGAAAQYGSDAIAGVINIILKNSPDSGGVSALVGSYGPSYNANTHGNGLTRNVQADKGYALGEQGFLHVSADLTSHLHSNQTGPDRNIYSPVPRVGPGTAYPWVDPNTVSAIIGDPAYILGVAGFNSGFEFDNGVEVYAFGAGGGRRAESFQNYRAPNWNGAAPASVALYPFGFLPAETIHESDWAVTGGVKGGFLDDGRWDLSFTYGADEIDVGVNQTANASLFNDTLAAHGFGWTPRQFYIGQYSNSQRTINLGFTKPFSLSFLPAPINVAFGAENRHETYKIVQGDFWSYYKGGPAAWVGIRPTDAGNYSREAFAGYVDLSTKPLPQWKVDVAGRFETYSDFGDTINGRFSTRYDFSPAFGVRGTVSTGFRAPTLAEQFYSQSTVTPNSANVVLATNSTAASIAGAQPLKPEKSTNITVGVVTELLPNLHATVDAYQIDIRDRIVSTGGLTGPTALAAIAVSGNVLAPGSFGSVSFFVNGANTRTRGVDVKADYSIDAGADGAFRFDFAASFFETTILSVHDAPPAFKGAPLLDAQARAYLTANVPHVKLIWGGSYLRDAWTFTLHFTQYGPVSSVSAWLLTGGAPYTTSVISPKLITDLEIGYDFDFGLHVALGGNNVFGVRPDPAPFTARFFNANVFSNFSPFGINGGYYYARASLKF